ncbi:MAG TPA: dienelactone hydrolase family protein [Methylothermaceae bacterium]|nr:dienelactone hydrolase family protein [Methylothermaceae bacterium]
MTIQTREVEYFDGDTRLLGFLAWDDVRTIPMPGILIAHMWGGREQFVCDKAKALAEMGYAGFALDMYGDAKQGSGPEENAKLMQPFLDDRTLLQRRMLLALETLRKQAMVDPRQTAAIGFCFGGLCVLDLARTGIDINGVVSFHGLLKPPGNTQGNKIHAKVLVLHGHDDPMVPVEDVVALENELTEADADWQIHVYGHTMHAFTNPNANDPSFGTVYNPVAERRSWIAMQNFFAELFTA